VQWWRIEPCSRHNDIQQMLQRQRLAWDRRKPKPHRAPLTDSIHVCRKIGMPVHCIETGTEPGMDFFEQLVGIVASDVEIVKEPGSSDKEFFLAMNF
jgi:hypothetical protein